MLVNSAVFILFAFSFFHPQTKRDWRSLGGFSAFVLALFVEMYGFPLTIYLLSGWIGRHFPQLDILSHDAGHLWTTLLGYKGEVDPAFVQWRTHAVQGANHEYEKRRAIVDAVADAVLRMPPQVAALLIEFRAQLQQSVDHDA